MTTRKSGLLGLALAVGLLSACESKNEIVVPPPDTTPTITVQVLPNPTNLVLGGVPNTQQMTATVSGGANTVTWSIAGTAATINATGLVTAAAVGQAVVTATSTVNTNIRGSATVIVTAAPPAPQPPTIVISAVTQGGTLFPVVTSNVMGQIDVVAVMDVQPGVAVSSVTFDLLPGGVAANAIPLTNCTQTFTGTGSTDLSTNAADPVQIICSINTAEVPVDTLGVPRFLNGQYSVRATINRPGNLTAIGTTSQLLTFNNPNFVKTFSNRAGQRGLQTLASMFTRGCAVSSLTTAAGTPGPGNIAPGTQWCGGDLQMRFVPTIFTTAADRPNTYTVTLTTSGVGSNGFTTVATGCSTLSAAVPPTTGTPNCPSSQIVKSSSPGPTVAGQVVDTVTFFTTSSTTGTTATNDITAVEDVISNIMITSANTATGLSGPACINPDAGTNPLVFGGGGTGPAAPNCGTGFAPAGPPFPGVTTAPSAASFWFLVNPMRVDNLAPRVFLFDMTPARLLCTQAACYINGSFTFVERINFFQTADYGVDGQTATFDVGPQTGFPTGATIGATSGLSHPETTSPLLVVRGNSTDRLQNTRAVFAGPVAATPVTTAAAAQPFGIDRTPPVITAVNAPTILCSTVSNAAPCNSTDNDEVTNVITVTFADSASGTQGGPSGFTATPVFVSTDTIHNAPPPVNTGGSPYTATVTCPSATAGVNGCDVTLPETTTNANAGYIQVIFAVRDAAFPGTTGAAGTTLGAFNTSASREFVHLDDENTPAVAGITAPSTISGANPVTFTADATDNVELGDVLASNSYTNNASDYYAHQARQTIGSYGISPLDFSRTAATGNALSVTMNPFIYSLEATTVAGAPSGAPGVANSINFAVRDVAGVQLNVACPAPTAGDGAVGEVPSTANRSNCIQRQNNNIAPNILAGTPTPASYTVIAPGIVSFLQNTPVHTGAIVTLHAEARGPQGTFANPFPNGVNFYRWDTALQRFILVATAVGIAVDDDIQLVRRWIFTVNVSDTIVPTGTAIRAIGINAGRGLRSGNDVIVP